MLKVQDLEFSYDQQQVFNFPNFQFEQGQQCLLLGQSGCGKTTLLHLIGGLLRPQKGVIQVGSVDLASLSGAQQDQFRGKNIGIIFQQSHLIKSLNVEENLLAAQYLAKLPQDKKKSREILERLNLSDKLTSKTNQLSQGEQQRVAIARALVNNPKLILADEPTSSLDDVNCKQVVDLLIEQSENLGATLIIVTHDGRLKEMFEHKIELTAQY